MWKDTIVCSSVIYQIYECNEYDLYHTKTNILLMPFVFKRHAWVVKMVSIVCSTVDSAADLRKHQSSASRAFVRWPVNSPHTWPVMRKMFPFYDVIMVILIVNCIEHAYCIWQVVTTMTTSCNKIWFWYSTDIPIHTCLLCPFGKYIFNLHLN